jgi:peroxiredoxin
MSTPLALTALSWLILAASCWLGWQLLRQNGRLLLRLDELEKRLDELEFPEPDDEPRPGDAHQVPPSQPSALDPQPANHHPVTSTAANGEDGDRANRFSNRSLARSKIKRDGLKAGMRAPNFRLPRLDGHGDLSLEELRGRRVLLVFSDPHCGPCQVLAPHLEKYHSAALAHEHEGGHVVMISRGEPKENRSKVKEHGLTFPVVLQQQWEISRLYAMFATPMAHLIDEQGVFLNDVTVGVEPILRLIAEAKKPVQHEKHETAAAAALAFDSKAGVC